MIQMEFAMKKTIVFAIIVSLILLCGCSDNEQNKNTVSLEEQYYTYAQECIEKGDSEKAISALEEGIEKTDSEKLKELLESLKEKKESEVTSSESSTESTKFKIPDKLIAVFNSTREQTFGSKPYDFTTQGNECYYSDDRSFVVYYYLNGSLSETPCAIEGEIQTLIPGKSSYTAEEIQNIFAGYSCEKYYSEIDDIYEICIKYENYTITISAAVMNSYTSFMIQKQ